MQEIPDGDKVGWYHKGGRFAPVLQLGPPTTCLLLQHYRDNARRSLPNSVVAMVFSTLFPFVVYYLIVYIYFFTRVGSEALLCPIASVIQKASRGVQIDEGLLGPTVRVTPSSTISHHSL